MQESFKINFHQRAPWSKKTTKTIGNWKHISRITCHVFFSWSNLKTLNIISLLLIKYLSKIAVVKKKSKTDCDRKRRWHYLSIGSTHDILAVGNTYLIFNLILTRDDDAGTMSLVTQHFQNHEWWTKHTQTSDNFSNDDTFFFLDDEAQNINLISLENFVATLSFKKIFFTNIITSICCTSIF